MKLHLLNISICYLGSFLRLRLTEGCNVNETFINKQTNILSKNINLLKQ